MTKRAGNYLIQSNYFTKSVLRDASEMQKEILYYLQSEIDFHDPNATGSVVFNFEKFLKYKNIKDKKNTYSPSEFFYIINGLRNINGVFYNKQAKKTVFFNLVDSVEINDEDTNEFTIRFANFGKVFFFEKFALEYVESSKVPYTQIEKNIIDLKGDKRKKFFELLSQYKETGVFRVSIEEFKMLLGFIEYTNNNGNQDDIATKQMQLELLFNEETAPIDVERVEYLKVWSEFKRVFLDPAVEEINKNSKLDIDNLIYIPKKTGRKITAIEFRFKKRIRKESLSEEEIKTMNYFVAYGMSEAQALFLLQRLGYTEMYRRLNQMITFNSQYDNKDSPLYRRNVWFENISNNEIKNLGGFFYEKMFPELKNE